MTSTTPFAHGVADATPHVYAGPGGPTDPAHARVRRAYRRLCRRLSDPTAGRAYLPGEWDALRQAGRTWAARLAERLAHA